MKQELINHFSGWWLDFALHPEDYYLVLSDDMDSLFSCRYLKKRFGAEIGGFYAFGKGLHLTDRAIREKRQLVYVDCACVRDGVLCFDNHRTIFTNHMTINPNLIMDRQDEKNYFRKYCGSTLMLLYSLYHGELSELEKEFLLAIDGFYIGWYRNNGKYKDINEYWLDVLELDDLKPILEKRDMQYFIDLIANYRLNEKIYIEKNKLFTFADILPKDCFNLVIPTETRRISKDDIKNITIADRSVFTAAETFDCSYSADFILRG